MPQRLTSTGKATLRKEMGSRLRSIRKFYGYTREELSEALDLSLAHIGLIERGERGLNAESLIGICSVFQCSADYLLTGKENFAHKIPADGSQQLMSIDLLNDHSKQKLSEFIRSLSLQQCVHAEKSNP